MKDSDYKTIGDVAKILNLLNEKTGKLNTHTIRFWEKNFKQINPIILSGKRRYYDNKTIELLKEIKFLLKVKGLTVRGVKKYLNNKNSLPLDEKINNSIKMPEINLKKKLKRISNLIKDIKKIK
tara:strand:+ start:139 stop:510 length:372 start_codon:yes stop_codon:yes gene_type:complete